MVHLNISHIRSFGNVPKYPTFKFNKNLQLFWDWKAPVTCLCNSRKNIIFDAWKKKTNLPWVWGIGWWGGGVIWAKKKIPETPPLVLKRLKGCQKKWAGWE